MKIVLDHGYGCYGVIYTLPEKTKEFLLSRLNNRSDPELVSFVKNHPEDCDFLHIVEIPDNANDWRIFSGEGGIEIVIYVVDNQLYSKS